MRLHTVLGTAAASLLLASSALAQDDVQNIGQAPAQPTVTPAAVGIAAVVNSDIITSHDLRQRVLFILATTGAQRDEASLRRIQAQAMRNLIDEHLQMQEAERYEQTISDREVNASVAQLIGGNGLEPQQFVEQLAGQGVSIETMRDQVRSEIAWQRITRGLFGQRIRISDSVIDESLSRLTANASKPSYRVAEIYIEATPEIGGMEGATEGANAMIAQLEQGAPFPLLAQQFSSAPSAAAGGDIGFVKDGDMRPELEAAIKTMEVGTVSQPIQVPGGIYVLALLDTQISESDTLYVLRQVTVENADMDAAKARLADVGASLSGCDTLADDVAALDDVTTADMGELKASELSEEIVGVLASTEVGSLSAPIERPTGATSIMVCSADVTGTGIPTRDEVENRLIDSRLAQASRRHLRDLRRKATVDVRG